MKGWAVRFPTAREIHSVAANFKSRDWHELMSTLCVWGVEKEAA